MPSDHQKGKTGKKIGGLLGQVAELKTKETPQVEKKAVERAGEKRGEAKGRPSVLKRIKAEKKEVGGKVLEKGRGYEIIQKADEKTPVYVVSMPELDKDDKRILKEIERRAIGEISVDPQQIMDIRERKATFVKEILNLMKEKFGNLPKSKRADFAGLIVQDMVGYGLIDPLLENDLLEEVMIVGTEKSVYVYHRKHGMCRTNIVFESDEEIGNIVSKIARSVGRRVDMSSPLLDARLPDGSRVNATVPPSSLDGPSLTIRKFKADPLTVVDIIKYGTMNTELASFLWLVTEGFDVKPANMLISGGTGSGKTTTLNCLGSFIPKTDRVISIEDTAELQLPVEHWIQMETRPPNVEGKGEVSMDMLLKNTLRMRPDRIVVGEVRGSEAMTLLASMNTGQSGCLGTLHANTAKETVTRLTNAPMLVPIVMIPSLNLILMQNRFTYKGKVIRRITEIAEIGGISKGKISINTLYTWDPKDDVIKPTGNQSSTLRKLAEIRGVSVEEVKEEMERRGEILKYMVETKVTGIKNVSDLINEYYTSPGDVISRVRGEPVTPDLGERKKDTGMRYSYLKDITGVKGGGNKVESVLEKREGYRIEKIKGEKNPVYKVSIPEMTKEEKKLLIEIEKRAIGDIKVDPSKVAEADINELFSDMVLKVIQKFYSDIKPSKRKTFARLIVQNMIGYGLLDLLLKDDDLEEIMVVGTGKPLYVNHRKYGALKTNITFESDAESRRIIEKIATSVGRRIDKAMPLLDARLFDGSRVNATIPPLSLQGPTLTIRKFKADPLTIVDLINFGTLSPEVSAYLWLIVDGFGIKPGNILVAGGSGCGKTTTLNCMCSAIPSTDRVITIEDTAELHLPLEHCIRLETRPPNVEGVGEVSMDDLVKNTLRMRPDRIIVGEVRGSEARTLFTAMNTGHDGCMGTVHANSAKETIIRLTNPPMSVPDIMLPALDLILMQNKVYQKGNILRRITEIAETSVSEDEKLVLNNVFTWDPKDDSIKPTGAPSVLKHKIAKLRGVGIEEIDEEIRRREKILSWMVENNISNIDDVAMVFTKYYIEAEKLLKEILPEV
ncbi:MAG: CpaF family protein [Candidatus Hydrothermarchaeaceae archaeon]